MNIDSRAQAAVTDALYFLMIVTFLAIFLFGFANSYGTSIREQINDEFNTVFATNALKTVLYSSTPRDPGESIYDQDAEVDYLLAIIKEDYSDDQEIGPEERVVLGKTVRSIMSPVQDSKDYIFFITIPEQRHFVYFYFHTTNFIKEGPFNPGRVYFYGADAIEPHKDYFCALCPNCSSGDKLGVYEEIEPRMGRLLANVGPTSQASSALKLVLERPDGTFGDFRAQADLVMWDAVWLGATDERTAALFDHSNISSWYCEEVS